MHHCRRYHKDPFGPLWRTILQEARRLWGFRTEGLAFKDVPEEARAGIFEESMGARNQGGIGLWLHKRAEFIPWNRFLGRTEFLRNSGKEIRGLKGNGGMLT
jgi:hypothetical protein